ncbi:NADP-dependent 3-hydroxy acid dehydrogenase YdfG [Clostridium beijerinckii]|nr:NADP-dependent 3-hydroxy acid dehydrogenase YdfG [Clostridium beijerinckii]NRT84222.1 NADP-dependent 3-hydroxy acid dehydrogenase YdfG [Clostridium beijerinckii]NRU49222.1 NADP-dependent 3-hydroxy acid dehydrogenase YdfG [Clostridium beijerinckii]NRZ28174.1 NADP-dependent 3-hydroxy acid dehydrogenase YdfG [Clostridium beijerinckii]NRZ32776.1 NADP-dependent 3-hydroxy acid dehydrogenase YdfG [Clostridium beijerinckii]
MVTEALSGIGKAYAEELASKGWRYIKIKIKREIRYKLI